MKTVIVILLNDDFCKDEVMGQVNSINASQKLCKDLSMCKVYGAKVLKGQPTKVYTAKKYLEHVEELYSNVEGVEIKAVIDLEAEKPIEDYEADDLTVLKKGELDMLCKEHEDIFEGVKYSTLNKKNLINEMLEAIKAQNK